MSQALNAAAASRLHTLVEQRRSAALFQESDGPSRELLLDLLGLAITAPNHKFTFPWRFHIVSGDERTQLGKVWADEAVAKGWVPEASRGHEQAKLERAPVVIFVGVVSGPDDPIVAAEDHDAVASAVTQLLLLLEDAGFAGAWRTGRMVTSEAIAEALSYQPGEATQAIVYVGQRKEAPLPPRLRPPVERVVSWGLHPEPLTSPTARDAAVRRK